jgi:hypothetical protein
MITKPNFLITMLISAAAAALIFAYSTPTQGAGAAHSQKSDGANQIKVDPATGPGKILDPPPPPTGSINDAKLKKIDSGAAIPANQGVAGKLDSGEVTPKAGKLGPKMQADTEKGGLTMKNMGTTDNGDGTTTHRVTVTDSSGHSDAVIYTTDNKTGQVLGCDPPQYCN